MPLVISIGLRWNDRLLAGGYQGRDNAFISVVGFIRQNLLGFYARQKLVCTIQIMSLPGR